MRTVALNVQELGNLNLKGNVRITVLWFSDDWNEWHFSCCEQITPYSSVPYIHLLTFCWSVIITYTAELCWQGPFHNWWARDSTSDYNEWSACWSQCRRNTAVSPGIPVHRWAWGSVSSRLETRARNSKHQHIKLKTSNLSSCLCCVDYIRILLYCFFLIY